VRKGEPIQFLPLNSLISNAIPGRSLWSGYDPNSSEAIMALEYLIAALGDEIVEQAQGHHDDQQP